jgi:hypothetical protein
MPEPAGGACPERFSEVQRLVTIFYCFLLAQNLQAKNNCWTYLLSMPSRLLEHRKRLVEETNRQGEESRAFALFKSRLKEKGEKDPEELFYPLRLKELGHNLSLLMSEKSLERKKDLQAIRSFLNLRIETVYLEWAKRDLEILKAELEWTRAYRNLYEAAGEEVPSYSSGRERKVRALTDVSAALIREEQRFLQQMEALAEATARYEEDRRKAKLIDAEFSAPLDQAVYSEFAADFADARARLRLMREAANTGPFM